MKLDSVINRFGTRRTTMLHLTGLLAVIVAGVHLYWGIPRFLLYASIGAMPDPRPPAFVLSGHVILIAVTLVAAGVLKPKHTYLPGMALMVIHIGGYVAWHTILSHGASAAHHSHPPTPILGQLQTVVEHIAFSPLVLVAKTTELGVLLLLAVLYLTSESVE